MRIIVRVLVGIVAIPLAIVLFIPATVIALLYFAGATVMDELR